VRYLIKEADKASRLEGVQADPHEENTTVGKSEVQQLLRVSVTAVPGDVDDDGPVDGDCKRRRVNLHRGVYVDGGSLFGNRGGRPNARMKSRRPCSVVMRS
jgi:hypothetical protein